MHDAVPDPRRRRMRRIALMAAGWLLLVLTPFVAIIPGPGGVFVFAAGLSLLLKSSRWAQRLYVRFARRWPKAGAWSDWALRRPSARRRAALVHGARD